jgi:hypothetical protein
VSMTCRPLFIFGVARSGTNLLARVLDRHPAVSIAFDPLLPLFRSLRNAILKVNSGNTGHRELLTETPFQDYYYDVHGPEVLDLILNGDGLNSLPDDELKILRKTISDRAALESPDIALRLTHVKGKDYREVFRSALDIIRGLKTEAAWAGTKEVWVLEFAPLLHRLFPDAHFLLIERDPRAVIASLLALSRDNPTQAAHVPSYLRHWRKQVALARRFEADPAVAGCFQRVSYERLVTAPEETAVDLCRVLGLEFREEMLHLSADGWQGNSSYKHHSKDIYSVTVDRWKSVLPRALVETADFLCGPEMLLTPYRPMAKPDPKHVLEFFVEADKRPSAWRSDSGDVLRDFGCELVRLTMVCSDRPYESGLIRRCFLLEETYAAIRALYRTSTSFGAAE